MHLCDNGHQEVCYEDGYCPVCYRDSEINRLKMVISSLKKKVKGLKKLTPTGTKGGRKMSMQPTVRQMQEAIMTIRKFALEDDYNLCRPYLKDLVLACADTLDRILEARDWEPVEEE